MTEQGSPPQPARPTFGAGAVTGGFGAGPVTGGGQIPPVGQIPPAGQTPPVGQVPGGPYQDGTQPVGPGQWPVQGGGPTVGGGPRYGAGPGYADPAYGANPGDGAGPGYGADPAYGANPAYGASPAYGAGPGYGAGPAYGAGPGYGAGPAYGGGQYDAAPAYGGAPVQGGGGWRAGQPQMAYPQVVAPGRPARSNRALLWYGGAAGGVLVIGLVVVLALLIGGQLGSGKGPLSSKADPPTDTRPPLARLCPAPTATNEAPPATDQPPVTGPRTTDEDAGISYIAYGAPWVAWPLLWRMGTLEVPYGVGQHFVTESYPGGEYHASILSAAVPATVNDSTAIDLECVGRQVVADVEAEYYPRPNTHELLRDERTTLGGRPAWVTKFRMHFDEPGLRAKSELVSVALIDVGRPTAAVLYVSIPDTNPEWDHAVDDVLTSVRPT